MPSGQVSPRFPNSGQNPPTQRAESLHRLQPAITSSLTATAPRPLPARLADFLLLPGDGLILINGDAAAGWTVSWLDRSAQRQLGPTARAWPGQRLEQIWPQLQQALEEGQAALEQGPQDLHLAAPDGDHTNSSSADRGSTDRGRAEGGGALELRLFRTDTGIGVGLLQPRSGEPDDHPLVQLLSTLLNTVQDSLLVTLAEPLEAPGPLIVYANEALLRETGYRRGELLGRNPRRLQGPDTDRAVTRRFGQDLRRWQATSMEVLNYTRQGEPYWTDLKVAPVADRQGWYTHWVSVQRDVSERKASEWALVQQALSDPLTGLPNRRGLSERLDQALRRDHQPLALIFCDLDRFKEVNDRYGHAVGDALLLELTHRLQTVLRDGDTLARLGGDEFVVLIEHLQSETDALMLAERLRHCLDEPWRHGDEELSLSMSMGVALNDGQGPVNADELLRRADLTMYQVKASGRDGIALYSVELDQQVQATVSLRQQLEQALRHERLLLHYQPLVDLQSGEIRGAEGLVRLRGADATLIRPDAFIPVAERTGLIVPMENWVLVQALETLATWQSRGLGWRLAINVSPQHLERGDLADHLLREQRRTGADLRDLTVEITETVLLQAHAHTFHNLSTLKQAGVSIALDDFGTGYSSLAWLSQLPIDLVKIDRSYIRQMADNPRCAVLIRGFVQVFHDLGLKVVAEGIETEAQRSCLLEMGCHLGQGYLFGRPVERDILEQAVRGARPHLICLEGGATRLTTPPPQS